jgi:hypothetical protein
MATTSFNPDFFIGNSAEIIGADFISPVLEGQVTPGHHTDIKYLLFKLLHINEGEEMPSIEELNLKSLQKA